MAVNLNCTSSWISFLFAAVSHKIGVVESCFNLLLKLTSISGWLSPPFGVESGQFGVKSRLNMQGNPSLVWFWIRLSHPNMAFCLLLNSLPLGYLVVESHFHLVLNLTSIWCWISLQFGVDSPFNLLLTLPSIWCWISLPFPVDFPLNLLLNLLNLVLNLNSVCSWIWLYSGVESH